MRKLTSSAAGARKLDQVKAAGAVDLGSADVLAAARRRRKLAAYRDRVQQELDRIATRVSWLNRKAARLPVNSNARKKAMMEAAGLQASALTLTQMLDGKRLKQAQVRTGRAHIDRAIRLANELATVE